MNLVNLKVACFLYNQFTDYDNNYLKFLSKYENLDLIVKDQVVDLIKWLRSWGCRQFKNECESTSIASIKDWYNVNLEKIPNNDIHLIDYDLNQNNEKIIQIFNDLSCRVASKRTFRNKTIEIQIGPVGTAKTLFAINPNLFAPWDTSIYHRLNLNGNGIGYVRYLKIIQQKLKHLRLEAESKNINWNDIFSYLKKKHKSHPKLIDEYFWVTITKGCDTGVIEKIFCGKTS